ncbi:MAG: FAD-dependent oxidoreductase [SAR202 cluster bacterium]|nr:FAD-dependent oxidoreductase [SAR202 cluster bacterium]
MEITEKHDVVIVGGGPGGSAISMYLKDLGISSVIVEQEAFPRYHIGESMTGEAGALLRGLGFGEEMKKAGHPVKQGVKVFGNSPRGTWFVPVMGRNNDYQLFDQFTWQVRRDKFDKMMLDGAKKRGATVIHGKATKPIMGDDGSVRGVQVKLADGGTMNLQSEILLDCSGQATFLANAGATGPKYLGNYDKQIAIFSQVSNAIRDEGTEMFANRDQHRDNTLIFYKKKYHWAWSIPLDKDVVSIGIVSPSSYFQSAKESKKDFFMREVRELHPELSRRVPEINLVEDVHVIPNYSFQVQNFCGKGYMCIGDAHRFVDPIFSFGLYVTMQEAKAAAGAVKGYLEGANRDADNPFAEYMLTGEKSVDVMEDMIDLFWERPLTFAGFVHFYYKELILDIFAGRTVDGQPSEATGAIRNMLKRTELREESYKHRDIFSMPVGSRYHPERAPLWEANSTVESTEQWMGAR